MAKRRMTTGTTPLAPLLWSRAMCGYIDWSARGIEFARPLAQGHARLYLGPITPKVVAQIRAVGAGGCRSANTFATIRSVTLRHELQIEMKDQIISYREMFDAESVTSLPKDDPRVCRLNCYATPLFRSAAVSCFMPYARFSRPAVGLQRR